MEKDIRREQVALLRLEKQIAGLATVVAASAASAQAADAKMGAETSATAHAEISAALVHLADAASRAHDALNAEAMSLGMRLLEIRGVPKDPPSQVVRSILGLG